MVADSQALPTACTQTLEGKTAPLLQTRWAGRHGPRPRVTELASEETRQPPGGSVNRPVVTETRGGSPHHRLHQAATVRVLPTEVESAEAAAGPLWVRLAARGKRVVHDQEVITRLPLLMDATCQLGVCPLALPSCTSLRLCLSFRFSMLLQSQTSVCAWHQKLSKCLANLSPSVSVSVCLCLCLSPPPLSLSFHSFRLLVRVTFFSPPPHPHTSPLLFFTR